MKNPYKKGKIHPSPSSPPSPPSPPPTTTTANFLALLPAAILALTAALSPQDKEVLAYLISCCHRSSSPDPANHRNKPSRKTTTAIATAGGGGEQKNHGPTFECSCFRCYMTYWARWDASSSRHVIHEIIEAYEEAAALTCQQKRKTRKRGAGGTRRLQGKEGESMMKSGSAAEQLPSPDASYEEGGRSGDGDDDVDSDKSAVRKIVSFVGDRIIGIFGGV